MHYWYNHGVLEKFIDGPLSVRMFETNSIRVSKDTLLPWLKSSCLKCYARRYIRPTSFLFRPSLVALSPAAFGAAPLLYFFFHASKSQAATNFLPASTPF
jgi:hypothetical protein